MDFPWFVGMVNSVVQNIPGWLDLKFMRWNSLSISSYYFVHEVDIIVVILLSRFRR